MTSTPDFRTPLARARGLGSAHEGVGHWWMQRLTAVALVVLGLWFMASWLCLRGQSYDALVAWLREPIPAALMIFLVLAATLHGVLGLQVVVEDYVHGKLAKLSLLVGIRFLAVIGALIGVFSVLKIAFTA